MPASQISDQSEYFLDSTHDHRIYGNGKTNDIQNKIYDI